MLIQKEDQGENMAKKKVIDASDTKDVQANKLIAILAYVIFFLPLLTEKRSRFAMYHANQGLALLLLAVGVNIVGAAVPIIGWFIVAPVGNLVTLVLFIIGVVHAANGEMQPLPLVGNLELLH